MPHEWNNILVVTKDELIPEFFPSWEALRKKLARDEKKAFGLPVKGKEEVTKC